MRVPFVSGEYTARSSNEDSETCINFYTEMDRSGKYPIALYGSPGLKLLGTIGTGPCRGKLAVGAFDYIVSGTSLYKVASDYSSTLLGTVAGTGLVSMSASTTQIVIVTGSAGYVVTIATAAFVQITDPDFPSSPISVDNLDGYFLVNNSGSQTFYYSSDGTAWDALDFASAESNPDNLIALIVDHHEVFMMGDDSIESWFSSGVAATPFEVRTGSTMECGLAAPFSVAKLDNSVFWLGKDARGQGVVFRANGYTPVRVSTHAVEFAIQNYSTISDAQAYSYQQEGHAFYVLTFPTAGATWVYDASTQLWHRRGYWQQASGTFTRHRSSCFGVFNGKLTVGDYLNGNIYELDLDTYDDNGDILRSVRSCQTISDPNTLNPIPHGELQIDLEAGVGLNSGQGSDPQIMLRWSDDGGHTWSNYHYRTMGAIGNYNARAIWRRLGLARQRVYEMSITDPVKRVILGAVLK